MPLKTPFPIISNVQRTRRPSANFSGFPNWAVSGSSSRISRIGDFGTLLQKKKNIKKIKPALRIWEHKKYQGPDHVQSVCGWVIAEKFGLASQVCWQSHPKFFIQNSLSVFTIHFYMIWSQMFLFTYNCTYRNVLTLRPSIDSQFIEISSILLTYPFT